MNIALETHLAGLVPRLQIGSNGLAYVDLILEDIRSLVTGFSMLLLSHIRSSRI